MCYMLCSAICYYAQETGDFTEDNYSTIVHISNSADLITYKIYLQISNFSVTIKRWLVYLLCRYKPFSYVIHQNLYGILQQVTASLKSIKQFECSISEYQLSFQLDRKGQLFYPCPELQLFLNLKLQYVCCYAKIVMLCISYVYMYAKQVTCVVMCTSVWLLVYRYDHIVCVLLCT